jgi:glycosyltransferase involved in cell wall biosynthesis
VSGAYSKQEYKIQARNMPLVEVRVPTYRRPQLLERALRSLLAQTERDWIAHVFDDSPDREAEKVVRAFADSRIRYTPHPKNLGCAANLDFVFAPQGFGQSEFACVLEDDNWFHPECLAENIRCLNQSGLSLLLRNQEIISESRIDTRIKSYETTRGNIFAEGVVLPLVLHASMFFCEGISNGGLFWRTSAGLPLRVGRTVAFSGLQEYCRSMQISQPLYFAREPLAVYSWVPTASSSREKMKNRSFARGRQAILRHLLNRHGVAMIDQAWKIARFASQEPHLRLQMMDVVRVGSVPGAFFQPASFMQLLKGIAKLILIPDPIADYWRDRRKAKFGHSGL